MNKVINILTFAFLFFYSFFTIGWFYDLNFSVYHVKAIPYLVQIIYGLNIIVLLLGILRIKRRWEGLKDVNAFTKFVYSTSTSKKSTFYSNIFFGVEVIFLTFFLLTFFKVSVLDDDNVLFPMYLVLAFLILESLVFIYKVNFKRESFKIGINKNLLAYFEREIHIFYFDGLQRISVYQNRLHFQYKKDLSLFLELDIVPKNELESFLNSLETVLTERGVYIDESYREEVFV
jgi:hypothetical protein